MTRYLIRGPMLDMILNAGLSCVQTFKFTIIKLMNGAKYSFLTDLLRVITPTIFHYIPYILSKLVACFTLIIPFLYPNTQWWGIMVSHWLSIHFPVCLFVLRFYGPVNPMGSCRAQSVYLTTRLLGSLVL